MRKGRINKEWQTRAFYASVARLVSVALGAGAGSLIYNLLGTRAPAWPFAIGMSICSFFLLWYVEYERETVINKPMEQPDEFSLTQDELEMLRWYRITREYKKIEEDKNGG